MSATTNSEKKAELLDDETPSVEVRRTFKTTEENKTETPNIRLPSEVEEHLKDKGYRSARWRSFGQLMNDILIYYLDGGNEETSYETIMEETDWGEAKPTSFNITETLFNEIDLMVNHSHTNWNTKQEFYICAVYHYMEDDYPAIENLR